MGARHLSVALIALLFLAPLFAAQAPAAEPELGHPRSVRLALLSDAWEAASEEAREAVRASFLGWTKRGLPAVYSPGMEELGGLLHTLRGDEPAPLAERKLADSLDLTFAESTYGTPEDPQERWAGPLTIDIVPVHPRPEIGVVELSLYWISPDGEEFRARTEPIAANAFRPPGFEMFVKAPVAKPGETWHLISEVTTERGSARGLPLAVNCAVSETDGGYRLSRERPLRGFGAELFECEYDTGKSARVLEPGDGEARRNLLVVIPMHEDPGWILSGPRRAAWRELARESRCRVVVTNLPLVSATQPSALGLARFLLERDESLLVFSRGQEAARLQAERGAVFCDALAISYPLQGREPRAFGVLPTLFVDVLADEEATETRPVEGGGPLTWIRRREPPLVAMVGIPAILRAWIENLPE